jgi:hypothetical protein
MAEESWFQASVAMLRSAVFWDITRRRVVIVYRRFGTTCRSHLHGLRVRVGNSWLKKLLWLFKDVCFVLRSTVDPRTSNGLMFEQLETRTKIRGKSGFETRNKNSKVEQRITWSSRGRLLSLLGSDERRVIHLSVNSNIPPTIIIDYYTIFFMYVLL